MMQENATIHHLAGDLLHYTYQTIEQHAKQMERFSTIAAKALFDKGEKPSYSKLIINPAWAFIKGYLLNLDFWMVLKVSGLPDSQHDRPI